MIRKIMTPSLHRQELAFSATPERAAVMRASIELGSLGGGSARHSKTRLCRGDDPYTQLCVDLTDRSIVASRPSSARTWANF